MNKEISTLTETRIDKRSALKNKGIEPYPYRFEQTDTIQVLRDSVELKENEMGQEVAVAGRIMTRRGHGKASFYTVRDSSGDIQIYFKQNIIGEEDYKSLELLDIGDIIGVTGPLFITRTGELTVKVEKYCLLSKSLRPLPEKWHGLKDVETRFRQRYLDLIVNLDVRNIFRKRSEIVRLIRNHFEEEKFLEVETPMMQSIAGGAAARPFVTHHNALDQDFYLRVAPELFLKRLLVGGLERVFEINRNFRNEGLSTRHNPEFTMLEAYAAYWDYNDMMSFTENLLGEIVKNVFAADNLTYQEQNLSFKTPFKRVKFYDAIKQYTGTDFKDCREVSELKKAIEPLDITVEESANFGQILNTIFDTYVQSKLIDPTFVIDYPVEISPLAKKHRDDVTLAERFELFISGMETGNAYSELNDPTVQLERFREQQKLREGGDDEAQQMDMDYITALEHGMPPAAGLGIGIDRLVMLLTDTVSIREVILFPQLRFEDRGSRIEI